MTRALGSFHIDDLDILLEEEQNLAKKLKEKFTPRKVLKQVQREKVVMKKMPVFDSEPCGFLWLNSRQIVIGY